MYLGREIRDWLFRLKEPAMEQRTAETLRSLAVTTIRSIRQPVASLSGGQRQSVAVAKAVQWNSKLVILDEPTAALGVAQTRQVLELVRRLAEQGLAVVIISHNLHDIFEVADRITVLRLGRDVGIYERETTTQQEVVQAITAGIPTKVAGIADTGAGGRAVSTCRRRRTRRVGPPSADGARARRALATGRRQPRSRATSACCRSSSARSLIVVFFSLTATNFFTAVNFINMIIQMAGVAMLAFGVVFVLLLGEIDLSIGYLSGIGALAVAELQLPGSGHDYPGMARDPARARRRAPPIGGVQGTDRREGRRAVVRRHARPAS